MIRRRNFVPFLAALALASAGASAVEVLIPSYFYPSGANNGWPQLNAAAGGVGITAILNPNSGPTATVDTTYRSAVNSLRAAGGRVIAYVSTSYAARPIADVKADILKYTQQYNVDGFFLDEQTSNSLGTSLNYYGDVYAYIKSLNADYRVVANPGTNTQETYLTRPTTDTLVTFEDDVGYASWNPSPWTSAYAPLRFSNLPYAIPTQAAMVSAVNAAASKRVGYVYVTDDSGANPWDRLPTYWAAELSAVRAITPTWTAVAGGDWSAAGNWTAGTAPNGLGAEAYLLGAITAARTIGVDAAVTLGTLSFNNANTYTLAGAGSLTFDVGVDRALIDVRRAGTQTISVPVALADPTEAFVSTGATLRLNGPVTIASGGGLTKRGAGTLTVASSLTHLGDAPLAVAGGTLALLGAADVGTLSVTGPTSRVEVGAAGLTVARVASIDAARSLVASAYAGGTFIGPGVAPYPGTAAAVGYAILDAGDGNVGARFAATAFGDADLDADVDFADLLAVAQHYGTAAGAAWADGDFNYDGAVAFPDLLALAQNYGAAALTADEAASLGGSLAADWALARTLVPEPTTALVMPLMIIAATRLLPLARNRGVGRA